MYTKALVELQNATVAFRDPSSRVPTYGIKDVSLVINERERIGVAGLSGSGKSTLALTAAGLRVPTSGQVLHLGRKPKIHSNFFMDTEPCLVQMVFQNPFASLNPRRTVGKWLETMVKRSGEGKNISGTLKHKALMYLEQVGLGEGHYEKFPGEISGGESQRACIAACLAANAKVIALDEPITMLDSISAKRIMDILIKLNEELQIAILVVSHNLSFLSKITKKLLVIDEGKILESGNTYEVLNFPKTKRTREMTESVREMEGLISWPDRPAELGDDS